MLCPLLLDLAVGAWGSRIPCPNGLVPSFGVFSGLLLRCIHLKCVHPRSGGMAKGQLLWVPVQGPSLYKIELRWKEDRKSGCGPLS